LPNRVKGAFYLHGKSPPNADNNFLSIVVNSNKEGRFSNVHVIRRVHHLNITIIDHAAECGVVALTTIIVNNYGWVFVAIEREAQTSAQPHKNIRS